MATMSAAELEAQRESEADSRVTLDFERVPRCDWPGPKLWLKIHADERFVVVSTDMIGKAEFSDSLFRERLEELTPDVAADVRGKERKDAQREMVEMRFDRNFEFLQLIIDSMRGDPIEIKPMDAFQRRIILAHCEFYRLPSIAARFKHSEPLFEANWDLARINSAPHTVVGLEKILRRTAANGKPMCNGLNVVAKFGDTKWVEFRIRKATATRQIMFGVVQLDDFATDGYFGKPIKGVGYYACNGCLYYPSAGKSFAEKSAVGDKIRIRVQMDASAKSAQFTVLKNGAKIGTEELSKYIALDSGLLFVVNTCHTGDEVQIVGFGTD